MGLPQDFVMMQTIAKAHMAEWEITGDAAHLAEVCFSAYAETAN